MTTPTNANPADDTMRLSKRMAQLAYVRAVKLMVT